MLEVFRLLARPEDWELSHLTNRGQAPVSLTAHLHHRSVTTNGQDHQHHHGHLHHHHQERSLRRTDSTLSYLSESHKIYLSICHIVDVTLTQSVTSRHIVT